MGGKNLSAQVFRFIQQNPGVTKADILREIPGLTTHSVDYRLTVMVELGVCTRERDHIRGRYKYTLKLPPEDGDEQF